MSEEKLKLNVICPVYNEQTTIPLFYERIKSVFAQLPARYEHALIFIDNCSQDNSRAIVKAICEKDANVHTIVMARNFGYQCSVECGLRNATGDLFVVIDVDCEDPPEMILEFLKYIDQYEIVYGERVDRVEGALLKLGRKMYYRLTQAVADEHFILDMAEFCMINAEVREAILEDNNSFPFIRASIGRIGFKRKNLPYKRHKRIAGETHYNFFRMAVFAVAGVLSSSTFLLRLPAYLFPFWAAAMISVGAVGIFINQGWYLPTMLLLGFGFCGFVLTSLSIYVARIYKNGLNRPNYVIDKKKSKMGLLNTSRSRQS